MIARLIGKPRNSRQIGYALKNLPNEHRQRRVPMSALFNPSDGFLDERMFVNGDVEAESESELDSSSDSEDENQNTQTNQPEADSNHSSQRNISSQESRRGRRRKTPKFHHNNVPWWRVLGSGGKITIRGRLDARERQAERLRQEGVECELYQIDMKTYEWNPPARLYQPVEE